MTTKEILAALKEPFHPDDLLWRVSQAGNKNNKTWAMVLVYVDDRAIQDRLDEVVGANNWQIAYAGLNGNATTATISIKLDGEWVSKANGAGATDIAAIKGGYSGASKRAASVWGIGRYLYNLKDNFAKVSDKGKNKSKLKGTDNKNATNQDIWYNWDAPSLPVWAMPNLSLKTYKEEMKTASTQNEVKDVARKYSKMVDDKVWSAFEVEEAGEAYHAKLKEFE